MATAIGRTHAELYFDWKCISNDAIESTEGISKTDVKSLTFSQKKRKKRNEFISRYCALQNNQRSLFLYAKRFSTKSIRTRVNEARFILFVSSLSLLGIFLLKFSLGRRHISPPMVFFKIVKS